MRKVTLLTVHKIGTAQGRTAGGAMAVRNLHHLVVVLDKGHTLPRPGYVVIYMGCTIIDYIHNIARILTRYLQNAQLTPAAANK